MSTTTPEEMIALIKHYVPSMQTQMQFDLFMAAFGAVTTAFEKYLSGDEAGAQESRRLLNSVLDTVSKEPVLRKKVEEIPPDDRGKDASKFVETAKQFTEIEDQRRLLAELEAIRTAPELQAWYKDQRVRIDGVVTQKYRDELFDAIRSKKDGLAN